MIIIHKRPSLGPEFAERERAREGGGAGAESGGTNRERNYKSGLKNGTTDTIRMMRCVNARCVSIGLVLALSNCSESGGEPDAMLDMHHPGTGIDSHHPQFHNSYGNMKFIIIVAINPTNRGDLSEPEIAATNIARGAFQVLDVLRKIISIPFAHKPSFRFSNTPYACRAEHFSPITR